VLDNSRNTNTLKHNMELARNFSQEKPVGVDGHYRRNTGTTGATEDEWTWVRSYPRKLSNHKFWIWIASLNLTFEDLQDENGKLGRKYNNKMGLFTYYWGKGKSKHTVKPRPLPRLSKLTTRPAYFPVPAERPAHTFKN